MSDLVFLNYDVFFRFFEPENKEEQEKVRNFFEDIIASKFKAFTTTHALIKLAECLESTGRWSREEIAHNIEMILMTPNIRINYRDVLKESLDAYARGETSLFNSFHIQIMKKMKATTCFSFDEELASAFEKSKKRSEER